MLQLLIKMYSTLLLILISGLVLSINCLYNQEKDHVFVLNRYNFDSVVFESDKIVFVEFYAHW